MLPGALCQLLGALDELLGFGDGPLAHLIKRGQSQNVFSAPTHLRGRRVVVGLDEVAKRVARQEPAPTRIDERRGAGSWLVSDEQQRLDGFRPALAPGRDAPAHELEA